MNEEISNYKHYLIDETFKKGTSFSLVCLFMFSIIVLQETYQVFYWPMFKMRLSQFLILLVLGLAIRLVEKYDKKNWIIPIYATGLTLSLANDLIVCTLVQTIKDIPEIFTKSHPIGIICYIMVLSLGALGARKYCKYTFPVLVILYDINSYLIGIENIQQLILINMLTLFLSYQMHVNERYIKKYFHAFKDTIDDKDSKLLESNKELKKVNSKLIDINFALSHDLKTPVHNIKIFSDLLKKEKKEQFDELATQYLAFVNQSSEHLYDLIEAMSHYANLSFGEELQLEVVNTEKVFSHLKNNYQALIHNKQLVLNLKENPPNVIGDHSNIYMVLQNIIDNGIQYNESKLKKIDVTHFQKNGKIYFQIKDNGIGINKEYHQQIFKPFKRLHNKDVYKGSGMGLAFSAEFMQQLGGSIKLTSEINQGSTFLLEFPEVIDHKQLPLIEAPQIIASVA